jgi:hypothetical protein
MDRETALEVHTRYCANRKIRTALVFLGLCLMITVSSWRPLVQRRADITLIWFVAEVAVVTILARLVTVLRCIRERMVLAIAIIQSLAAAAAAVAPTWIVPVAIRRQSFASWIVASLISLTMVGSAVREAARKV